MIRVLIVEDEVYVAESLVALLDRAGFEATSVGSAEQALEDAECDVVLADLKLPGMSGVELLTELRRRNPRLPVMVLTGHGTIPDAVTAMRAGAVDFLTKPVEPDVIVERLKKAVERGRLERERERLRGSTDLVAVSEAMRGVLALVGQVAGGSTPVLLTGETGVGKELVATHLHEISPRRGGELVKVNCAAIPATLFESEFFGYEKGAFTGAYRSKPGWFVEADEGTLFLDEVGSLSSEGQAKLLRAIEGGSVRPVGGTRPRKVDVRIVAATNEDLAKRAAEGSFRKDLFYRLAVFPISIPPLAKRPEDLRELAIRLAAPFSLTEAAHAALRAHDWPGNVRELRNVIEQARVLSPGGALDAGDLLPLLPSAEGDLDLKRRLQDFERDLFQQALRQAGGKKTAAARLLGIDPSNWAYHAKRLGLGR